MKKIIILVFVTNLLFGSAKYLNEDDYSNYDYRIFVGIDGSASYVDASTNIDYKMYSYGLYIGLPIFSNFDLIFKKKLNNNLDFIINQQSINLNIPFFSNRLTSSTFIGLFIGNGTLRMDANDNDGFFYGIKLGKKYKFTRHYYVRISFDATKYEYNLNNQFSIGFNYGFEYRF